MSTSRGPKTDRDEWRPAASLEALRARAGLLGDIRGFFASREVLEVETPLLGACPVTDVHLASFATTYSGPGSRDGTTSHLATSPELAMKRLLAAGVGPVFQICKAFRNGEVGRHHNPEFTILEWYRPGWDHHKLMDEVAELLIETLGVEATERCTYAEAFVRHTGIDPHAENLAMLHEALARVGLSDLAETAGDAAQALFGASVEPHLGGDLPTFVYDYPKNQAALARLRPGNPTVAERFELYYRGHELANGFHELCDATEQRRRFEADREQRRRRGLGDTQLDGRFLAALEEGLPACAGVAVGLDRLLMILLGCTHISEVLAFPFDRA